MILNGCCILNYNEQAMEKFKSNVCAGEELRHMPDGMEDDGSQCVVLGSEADNGEVPEYTALQCPALQHDALRCPSCNTIHHAATFIHEVECRRKLPHNNPYHINRLERYTQQHTHHQDHSDEHAAQVYSVKLHNIGFACLVTVLEADPNKCRELADTNAGDILCVRVRATSPEHAMQLAIKERFGSGDYGPTMYGTFRNECNYIAVSAVAIPSRNGRPLSRNFNS